LTLGRQWQEAAPVFRILAISGLGQLVLQSTVWLFVSRGKTDRLLKMLLAISPAVIGSFVIGLPFGIKGVALCYSLVLLAILPWVLKYAFRDTNVSLKRLGRVIVYPISICLISVSLAELLLDVTSLDREIPRLVAILMCFAVVYSISTLVPRIRTEVSGFRDLIREMRPASQPVTPLQHNPIVSE